MIFDEAPEALKWRDAADVYKAGKKAAILHRHDDHVEFAYLPTYLETGGAPVATTLPLGVNPLKSRNPGAVPAFFAGLLPEGRRLGALHRQLKTSADDEFTLLLAVGGDTIGDVQILPPGISPELASPSPRVQDLANCDFAELFHKALGADFERVALPGVQDKVSARMMTLPVGQNDGEFILKLNPPEFPHLVENEFFFLEAAKRSGIESAEATLVYDRHKRAGLLVRRFDRYRNQTGFSQRAQEDGCQVMGIYPADKYRVSSEELFLALSRNCRSTPVAALALLRQLAFAYISCNGDAHAKNFSILHIGGEWRVAPMYDVPSSHPYGDTTMALSIAGRDKEDIGRKDFLALAAELSLPVRAVTKALDQLIEKCRAWSTKLDELPFSPRHNHELQRSVEYRLARLAGR